MLARRLLRPRARGMSTLHQLLNLRLDTPPSSIRQAYLLEAKRRHPDVAGGETAAFIALQNAWDEHASRSETSDCAQSSRKSDVSSTLEMILLIVHCRSATASHMSQGMKLALVQKAIEETVSQEWPACMLRRIEMQPNPDDGRIEAHISAPDPRHRELLVDCMNPRRASARSSMGFAKRLQLNFVEAGGGCNMTMDVEDALPYTFSRPPPPANDSTTNPC